MNRLLTKWARDREENRANNVKVAAECLELLKCMDSTVRAARTASLAQSAFVEVGATIIALKRMLGQERNDT